MTCVCSVGLDMIAIPGDTTASTISGIIADEAAIGMVNQKTTAVRVIPVEGKGVGRWPTSAADGLCADHSSQPDQLRSFRDPSRSHPRPNPQLQKLAPLFPTHLSQWLRWLRKVAGSRHILFPTRSGPLRPSLYGLKQNMPAPRLCCASHQIRLTLAFCLQHVGLCAIASSRAGYSVRDRRLGRTALSVSRMEYPALLRPQYP